MRKSQLILTDIWKDHAFSLLGGSAKLVYLMLISQPDIAATGRLTIAAKRWGNYCNLTAPKLVGVFAELEEEGFIWCDHMTEELVVRSFIKHNVPETGNMGKAARGNFDAILSSGLRKRLALAYPSLLGDLYDEEESTHSESHSESHSDGMGEVARLEVRGKRLEVRGSDLESVWAIYRAFHPRSRLTAERRRLIERRLKEWPAETLGAAIRGNHNDPWCNGENPDGREYHELELIFRNASKIERYAELEHAPPAARSGPRRALELAYEAAEKERDAS